MVKKLEILTICILMLITIGLFSYTRNSSNAVAQDEFQRVTQASVASLEIRLSRYLQSLDSVEAFFSASERVTRDDFDDFVSALKINEFLPGLSGIGFVEPVTSGEEAAFLDRMRQLGEDRITMETKKENAERFIVSRIEPFAENAAALGLDITFEKGRREAAVRARDTGQPQLTPRISLVQDPTGQPGFILLQPVFEDTEVATLPSGQGEFLGWVYAPFTANDLLADLTVDGGQSYAFAVYDSTVRNGDFLIHDTKSDRSHESRYLQVYPLELYGRDWTIAYRSTPAFEQAFTTNVPYIILLVGILMTGKFIFFLSSLRGRNAALAELAALQKRQVTAREQENSALIDNAVTPIMVVGEADRIVLANHAALECFGYSASEIKELRFDNLIRNLCDDAENLSFNATGFTRSGKVLLLDVECNTWATHDGEPRRTVVVRDLTTEIETENELKKTKALYDMALQGARIGVFDVDLVKGRTEVSDTWCEIMGYAPECGGKDAQSLFQARVHPDDFPALQAADAACISGETMHSTFEYRVRFPNDEWRWMRSDAIIAEHDKQGTALRMIGVQSDVTDLRQARDALEMSEQRFRRVFAAAPIGMALMTESGKFLNINEALCKLCGYDERELLGSTILPDLMPAEDLQSLYDGTMQMAGSENGSVYRAEHRLMHKSGQTRWGLFNISWIFDKNEGRNFFIAQINDITDQKEVEQIKNEFVSTVSHELRTPLTSIKGALGLIAATNNIEMSTGSKRLIEIARSNTDRLTAIVNDILDLEKISSGEVAFDFYALDIREVIKEVVREMASFAVTHANTFSLELPDRPLWVKADLSRTKQVLANLMSNACKYSAENTEIVIRAEDVAGDAVVYVQNFGVGVPDSFKPKMFDAFSQADSSDTRAKGGTGLGLNISRQIVARHNGKIGFESIPNRVTIFWFTYPMVEEEQTSQGAEPQMDQAGNRIKWKVLHIEDDVDFAEIIRSGLRDVAEVTHVSSFSQARKQIAEAQIDVVILDWSLPDGDACVLLDEICSRHPNVRVLGLSADADRRRDTRLDANLVKSKTELQTLADHVSGRGARAS